MPGEEEIEFLEFERALRKNGIQPLDSQSLRLRKYRELLGEWNSKINLVSRTATGRDIYLHILHSICPLFLFSPQPGLRILDIGSGGGLPGIPLSILRQDLSFILVDSIAKKSRALQSMVEDLGLTNVQVINGRVEELRRLPALRSSFDIALARAVAPLPDLVRWTVGLMRPAGRVAGWKGGTIRLPVLMAWKGGDLTAELSALGTKTGCTGIVQDLRFEGIDEASLFDKKLVVVELKTSRNER